MIYTESIENSLSILQVVGTLDIGGAETMLLELVRSGLKTDFAVCSGASGAYEDELRALGCRIYHLTKRSEDFRKHHEEISELSRNYDIVHIHAQNAFLAYCQMKAVRRAGNARVFVHSHNTMDWRNSKMIILHKAYRKRIYREADQCLACGKDAATWMFGTSKNVNIIPLPVDTEKFRYNQEIREKIRRKYHIPGSARVMIQVGRFYPVKNQMFSLELARRNWMFFLGEGPDFEAVKKAAGGDHHIIFTGNVSNVNEYLSASDILLMPSFYEGLPLSLLEAEASGIKCLVSDNVTRDVAVTDLMVFLPLDREAWSKEIQMTALKKHREIYADKMKNMYDSERVLKCLNRIYRDALGV